MDIRQEIFTLLESLKCENRIRRGIVYVKTPEGDIWDFTLPEINKDKSGVDRSLFDAEKE